MEVAEIKEILRKASIEVDIQGHGKHIALFESDFERVAIEIKGKKMLEEQIADEFVTKALCEKVYAKIENEGGFTSKRIPQLLNVVYYDVVKEDAWNFVKKHKNPTINFSTLQHFVFAKVKEQLPQLF